MKPDIKKAKKHFERLRKLAAQGNSPLQGMTEEQIINPKNAIEKMQML